MARLLTLLMMFALVLTNSAAQAAAVCQHRDAATHAAARDSGDAGVAVGAMIEEAAAAEAEQAGILADAASAQLSGFVLPSDVSLSAPIMGARLQACVCDVDGRPGLAVDPLLEPPLA